jgi:hypothetical protein
MLVYQRVSPLGQMGYQFTGFYSPVKLEMGGFFKRKQILTSLRPSFDINLDKGQSVKALLRFIGYIQVMGSATSNEDLPSRIWN